MTVPENAQERVRCPRCVGGVVWSGQCPRCQGTGVVTPTASERFIAAQLNTGANDGT